MTMGALANLETRMLTVAPGAEAGVEIRVRNNGTVVDQFTLDVLGDASSWATADPASLSLFPGAEERARITFRPPRSHQITAGPMPFGVRVASREDPQGSVVEEGVLQVEPFAETTAELAPRTSRGSRSAVHDLAVDNRGNTRINAEVTASDPDQVLDFDVRPPGLVIDPGTAAIANVRVRAKQSFLRGQPKTRSFSVLVGSVGQPPVAVDGTLLQEQILPGWLPRALAAALALAVLAIVLWFMFLRPAIDSAATERAKDVLAAASLPVPPGPVPPRA
ncbi:MAG: hypothetical protein H0V04_02305, partial [Chloroflexi bacterium]|nr:hypothetical protein [Chloroflexota bacterium]